MKQTGRKPSFADVVKTTSTDKENVSKTNYNAHIHVKGDKILERNHSIPPKNMVNLALLKGMILHPQ
jgi:hypothetical protein